MAAARDSASTTIVVEPAGQRPGVIGRVTELHGLYYHQVWALDRRFEAEVGKELALFMERFMEGRDGLWIARDGDSIVGAIAIDAGQEDQRDGRTVRLRWFIVAPGHQGLGLGKRLLDAALAFCRAQGYGRVELRTFAGLEAARRLYESAGFRLADEHPHEGWGPPLIHQTFSLDL